VTTMEPRVCGVGALAGYTPTTTHCLVRTAPPNTRTHPKLEETAVVHPPASFPQPDTQAFEWITEKRTQSIEKRPTFGSLSTNNARALPDWSNRSPVRRVAGRCVDSSARRLLPSSQYLEKSGSELAPSPSGSPEIDGKLGPTLLTAPSR
jgi:hypothetical protein